MTIFYLEIENEIYALDSTQSVQKNLKAKLSQSLVEDGNYSSDNYVNNPISFTFSGIITSIKRLQGDFNKSPADYLDKINSAFANKLEVTVYYSDIQLPEENCYLTSFSHTQNSTHGNRSGANSFELNFTLQKVRYAAAARVTSRPSEAVAASVQSKAEKSVTTKSPSSRVNDLVVKGQRNMAEGNPTNIKRCKWRLKFQYLQNRFLK